MKIKDIAQEIIGGQIISRVEQKNDSEPNLGEIKILIPKAIKSGSINHENLTSINYKTELDKRRLTKKGDLVIKLSQPYDVAYITEADENLLVTSFCIILRNIDEKVDPAYLTSLLNSNVYKNQALKLTSGATIPILTKGGVEKIDLDILPLHQQKKIVEFSQKLIQKETLFNELISLEKLKLENMLGGEFV